MGETVGGAALCLAPPSAYPRWSQPLTVGDERVCHGGFGRLCGAPLSCSEGRVPYFTSACPRGQADMCCICKVVREVDMGRAGFHPHVRCRLDTWAAAVPHSSCRGTCLSVNGEGSVQCEPCVLFGRGPGEGGRRVPWGGGNPPPQSFPSAFFRYSNEKIKDLK